MSAHVDVSTTQMIFRKTNAHIGRKILASPQNSSMRYLAYGRIILNRSHSSESFSTADRETGLICLSGEPVVTVDSTPTALSKYDSLYVPRDSFVSITTEGSADIAEFSAEVAHRFPLQVVRFSEMSTDPTLKYSTGASGCTRHLNLLLAKNVQAGRLIVGFTDSEPGNWTSWPPHEHAAMLEEIYVYFNMPEPAFGIQLVYNQVANPELVTVVREGDAVLLPSGFHPNVAVPGHRICFLWGMAAHREGQDRQFGVVNVQPGFK